MISCGHSMRTRTIHGNRYPELVSLGALLIAMLSIQIGATLAMSLLAGVGAAGATALRLAFATLMLLAVSWPRRPLPRGRAVVAIVSYGFAMGAMNLFFYAALRRIPLGLAVAIEFTGPLAVATAASRRALDFLWVGLAVLGLLLLLPLRAGAAALDPAGVAFALAAGACWAAYIVFGRRAGTLHGGGVAALGVLAGALLIVPLGAYSAGARLWAPALWPTAAAVALLSSALPYSLEMFALTRLPARTFGILMSGEPVVAALAGLVVLGERLQAVQWLAIACIVAASAGSTAIGTPARTQAGAD
ncbi:MAG: EamA family transporter [Steroidobacteraceae bacterium]|nr:EamA family transporter [Steroidobacteraceae bacterium]